MKQITLMYDHRRWVKGKEILFKAGSTIEVSDQEHQQITTAVAGFRTATRQAAEKIPGSPEWERRNDR